MNRTEVTLRRLDIKDSSLVLNWRNSPAIRCYMSEKGALSACGHKIWLENALHDPRRIMLLALQHEVPVGFVQFRLLKPGVAEWGFYKSPDARKGLGKAICLAAISWCLDNLSVSTIIAKVIRANEISLGLHSSIGFEEISDMTWRELSSEPNVPNDHRVFKLELI